MFRNKALVSCILLSALLLVGCGDDGDDNPVSLNGGKPPAELVGTWVFQSVTTNGDPASLADVMEWEVGTAEARIMILAIGTYVLEEVNAASGQLWFESGFVFVSGNTIEINILQDSDGSVDEIVSMTYALASGILTLQQVEQGVTAVFTLTKLI